PRASERSAHISSSAWRSAASVSGPSDPSAEPSARTSSFSPAQGPRSTLTSAPRPPSRASAANSDWALTWSPRSRERSSRRASRSDGRTSGLVALDVDVDLAAARQPDVPRVAVGDAEVQQLRLAAPQHLFGHFDDGALDAAAGHGAADLAAVVDRHLRARRARGGALDPDHRGQGDAVPARDPGVHVLQDVLHSMPPSRRSASSCSEATEWPDRNSSTWGSAAAIPRASGS